MANSVEVTGGGLGSGAPGRALPLAFALAALCSLALSGGALAQEPTGDRARETPRAPEPTLERIWVPKRAFTQVLARHPSGVLLESSRLEELLARARAEAAAGRVPPREDGPQVAAIEQLTLSGRLEGQVVLCEAKARVALQGARAGLPLPLGGLGLTGIWVDERPAQVVIGEFGPVVLLPGGAATRSLRWSFALPVLAPSAQAERGAGQISFPVPPAASASFDLDLPGEFEHLSGAGDFGARWSEARGQDTRLRLAFGGGAGASASTLSVAWRPRRALDAAVPYVTAEDMSLCTLRRGVTAFSARVELAISRAPRSGFVCEVPTGFVVRELTSPQGAPSYLQRGDRVEVTWPAPRVGPLSFVLSAERPGSGSDETLLLRPLRLLDVDRQAGALGIAADADTVLGFPKEAAGMERTDLSELRVQGEASLVRVYLHEGRGGVQVEGQALAPRVSLEVLAAIQVQPRQLKALAFYRYSVQAGTIYSVRAQLPPGFALVRSLVRNAGGSALPHQREERRGADGQLELGVELERGLRGPAELLLTLECERELARGLEGGGTVAIPHFDGAPRHELRGLLGFSSDATFRLSGRQLRGLQGIPAARLPDAGLQAEGLSLGYRVEAEDYAGELVVVRRESRLSVEQREHHSVGERILTSEIDLELVVAGAPLAALELWLPAGAGQLANFSGPGLARERDRVDTAEGRERWRLHFVEPWAGARTLRVRFQTQLPGGEDAREADLPRLEVADAFRQRGALAIFGEGDAELAVQARGLRPLDATEAPRLDNDSSDTARPLFAYTWVRPDHALRLTIQRPGVTPVLTAVAEELNITTSAGPDGTARHEARFRLKNLDNQFFGLVLPEGASLWSVVVDGQGVKPAAQDGVLLIPIPRVTTDSRVSTDVVVTYTQAGGAWGLFATADLRAPALTIGTSRGDEVPVLRTTWALSLPEDTRVLEVAGNLRAAQEPGGLRPLLLDAWDQWRDLKWPWALVALGLSSLLIGASAQARGGCLAIAAGISRRGRQLRAGVAGLSWRRILIVAAVVTGLVLAIQFGLTILKSAKESSLPRTASRAELDPRAAGAEAPGALHEEREDLTRSWPEPRTKAQFGLSGPSAQDEVGDQEQDKDRGEEEQKLKRSRPSRRDMGRQPGRQRAAESDLAPPPPPAAAVPERRGRAAASADEDFNGPADMPAADPAPEPELMAESSEQEPEEPAKNEKGASLKPMFKDERFKKSPADGLEDAPAEGGAGGSAGPVGGKLFRHDAADAKQVLAEREALVSELNRRAQGQQDLSPAARVNDLGAGGEAGLRSLVLGLRSVGAQSAFSRPGGGAQLQLQLASERLFLLGSGLAALLGFLGATLLPSRRRLSGLALVCAGLVLSTAVPLVWTGALVAAIANALTIGLLGAIPPLGLAALSRVWASEPFARLGRAVRQLD